MANIITTLPSPGNPSRQIDADTGEVVPPIMMTSTQGGGFEIDYNQFDAGFKEYLKQNPASPGGRAVQIYPGGFQTNNTGETAAFNKYLSSIGAPIPSSNTVQSLAPSSTTQKVQQIYQNLDLSLNHNR